MARFFANLSLATKLGVLVAIMAILSLAVGGVGLWSIRTYHEIASEYYDTGRRAALAERVNGLVNEAVMESRGIYMSTEAPLVKRYGDNMLGSLDRLDKTIAEWEAIVPASERDGFAALAANVREFIRFRRELVRLSREVSAAAGRSFGDNDANRNVRTALSRELKTVADENTERIAKLNARVARVYSDSVTIIAATALGAMALALAFVFFVSSRLISAPLRRIIGHLDRAGSGDLDIAVKNSGRRDEVGLLEGALATFVERSRAARRLEEIARQEQVAKSRTAEQVAESVAAIRAAAGEISQGSNDLATRTERQASALQETVATMTEIAENVSANAQSSEQAQKLAVDALARAESGSGAVASVVTAMAGIDNSSSRIAAIIQVMEEISFQTKLLALNAAVEAARAGEAGKGFAVVAQEVRALADRSRQASQQIRDLIKESTREVSQGVKLAGGAGDALNSIIEIVRRVAEIAPEIAAGSREQSRSIAEINKALNDLDAATQQNAALVEESSAAAASLAEQAGQLVVVVASFRNDRERLREGDPTS